MHPAFTPRASAPIVGWVLTAWRVLLTMLAVNLDDFTYG
jgi:hypothetical protein